MRFECFKDGQPYFKGSRHSLLQECQSASALRRRRMVHKPERFAPCVSQFRVPSSFSSSLVTANGLLTHGHLPLSAKRPFNCAKLSMASIAAIRTVQGLGPYPAACSNAGGRSAHLGSRTWAASLQRGALRAPTALQAVAGAPAAPVQPSANGAAAPVAAPAVVSFPAPSPSQLVEDSRAFVEAHRWVGSVCMLVRGRESLGRLSHSGGSITGTGRNCRPSPAGLAFAALLSLCETHTPTPAHLQDSGQ